MAPPDAYRAIHSELVIVGRGREHRKRLELAHLERLDAAVAPAATTGGYHVESSRLRRLVRPCLRTRRQKAA